MIGGRPVVVIEADALAELVPLLEQAHHQRLYRHGGDPIGAVVAFIDLGGQALALSSLLGLSVNGNEDGGSAPVAADWVTTQQAGVLLGITPRAVLYRIARGVYPNAKPLGHTWLIPSTDLA